VQTRQVFLGDAELRRLAAESAVAWCAGERAAAGAVLEDHVYACRSVARVFGRVELLTWLETCSSPLRDAVRGTARATRRVL
jgi:hypothetical protein